MSVTLGSRRRACATRACDKQTTWVPGSVLLHGFSMFPSSENRQGAREAVPTDRLSTVYPLWYEVFFAPQVGLACRWKPFQGFQGCKEPKFVAGRPMLLSARCQMYFTEILAKLMVRSLETENPSSFLAPALRSDPRPCWPFSHCGHF